MEQGAREEENKLAEDTRRLLNTCYPNFHTLDMSDLSNDFNVESPTQTPYYCSSKRAMTTVPAQHTQHTAVSQVNWDPPDLDVFPIVLSAGFAYKAFTNDPEGVARAERVL